jgi:hypothetical protein
MEDHSFTGQAAMEQLGLLYGKQGQLVCGRYQWHNHLEDVLIAEGSVVRGGLTWREGGELCMLLWNRITTW